MLERIRQFQGEDQIGLFENGGAQPLLRRIASTITDLLRLRTA